MSAEWYVKADVEARQAARTRQEKRIANECKGERPGRWERVLIWDAGPGPGRREAPALSEDTPGVNGGWEGGRSLDPVPTSSRSPRLLSGVIPTLPPGQLTCSLLEAFTLCGIMEVFPFLCLLCIERFRRWTRNRRLFRLRCTLSRFVGPFLELLR
jgi:hypothetical protein